MKHLYKVSSFTKDHHGGNNAGVYVRADGMSDKAMQNIAKEVGYSETAFVTESDKADFNVRFFTPTSEVDLCGHATIATYHILKELNIIQTGVYTQETKAGILKIKATKNAIFMQQNKPVFHNAVDQACITPCFEKVHYHDTLKPYIVSTGMKEIFVPVKDKDTLHQLLPDFEAIRQLSQNHDCIGIHVFALDDEIDAYGRNFAPAIGINEESATGTSNGALACYLNKFHQRKNDYVLRQGYSMNLPSEIMVTLKTHHAIIDDVWVGGEATIIE